MATYLELFDLRTDATLQNKVAVATTIAAEAKLTGTPTAAEAAWALRVLQNPASYAGTIINAVLAANKAATTTAILAATDAAIQANVDAIVDGIITAGV